MKLLCILVTLVACLYEDQIGKFDWRKELIGVPQRVAFDHSKGASKHVTVHTEGNILAVLNSEDGEISWRRQMPVQEKGNEYLFNTRTGPITISKAGIVRFWDNTSGRQGSLIREAYPNEKFYKLGRCIRLYSRFQVICNYVTGQVSYLQVYTETSSKKITLDFTPDNMYSNEQSNTLFLTKREENHLIVKELTLNDFGQSDDSKSIMLEDINSDIVFLSDNKIAYLNTDRRVVVISMLTGSVDIIKATFGEDCEMNNHEETDSRRAGDVLVFSCYKSVRFLIDPTGSHRVLHSDGELESLEYKNGENIALVRTSTKTFKLFKINTGEFTTLYFRKGVHSVWPNVITQSSREIGFEISSLVLFDDETLSWIPRGADSKWDRQESLKNIATTQLFDLPSDSSSDFDPYNWTFSQRLAIQAQLFSSWISTIIAEIETGVFLQPKTRDPLINDHGLVRDQFNLHKIIFVVTKVGNAFGLDSLDGSIIWKTNLEEIRDCKIDSTIKKDTNINFGIAVVIAKCSPEHTRLIYINPVDGEFVYDDDSLSENLLRVETLRIANDQHVHPLVLFTDHSGEVKVKVIGYEEDQVNQIKSELSSTFYWFVRKESGKVQGIQVQLNDGLTGIGKEVWAFQLPSNQVLAMAASRDKLDVIHMQGKPLADRSVLYKYMNPNLIAVMAQSAEKTNVELMFITLYVIDAVTGEIIHTANHRRARKQINIVFCENWLVYTYWAAKMHRTEVTAVELYEGRTELNITEWSSKQVNKLPIALQNSYILDEQVTALGVSQSPRGITNRAVIMATKTGKIYSLPKMFFDARRKLISAPTDREEGIIPYEPQIKLVHGFAVNYFLDIINVKTFKIANSGLESTSVLFAIGENDLFWTRLQPSSAFDVLKDDFDHKMISIIMIGFFIGTYACKRFAQLKILNRLWQ